MGTFDRGLVTIKLLNVQLFCLFSHLYLHLTVNPLQEAISFTLIRSIVLNLLKFFLFVLILCGFLLSEATSTVILALLFHRCFFHCEAHLIFL